MDEDNEGRIRMTVMNKAVSSTNLALTDDARAELAELLNTTLADEHVLYTKLRNYHWNVTGMHFHSLHEMFEEQYDQVKVLADEIAERTRKLGYRSIGTMSAFLEYARVAEGSNETMQAQEMIEDLLNTNEAIVRNLRSDIDKCTEAYHDEGTADLLIATMREHESMAWMLRAMLQ
jgi:starvation-inducible DNA-binding protein